MTNPKTPLPPAGQRKRLVFQPELKVGQSEGDENYLFGSTIMANADDDGNLYVTDWDARRILKYDPSGRYLLTIGRRGQGPGEFQNLSVARFDKDGLIYVTDLSSQRISFFDRDGHFQRQILMPDVFEDLYVAPGGFYVSSSTVPLDDNSGLGFRIEDALFDEKFKPVTTFHSRSQSMKPPSGREATARARFTAAILSGIAFAPMPRHALAEDGTIYFGYPAAYAIEVYSPDGKKQRTITKAADPMRVASKDKDDFAAHVATPFITRTGGPGSGDDLRSILGFIEYPEVKPAFKDFSPLENGWLVVLVDSLAGDSSLFDLFDEKGAYIGQFTAPFGAEPMLYFFKRGKAYVVETDEEGYKSVRRFGYKIEDY